MNEKELKELERLARTAIEHNPQESGDLLEQAILERKDEMWQIIQKKARRRVRIRKAQPWIAAAAVVMMAVIVSGTIGINQARAGKDGFLVDIVEGVAGRVTFSGEPVAFLPITLEDGSWDDIMANIDPVMIPMLPEGLPEEYVFKSGTIDQPNPAEIEMVLTYINSVTNNIITIRYIYNHKDNAFNEPGIGEYVRQQWDGTDVHIMINGKIVNIVWQQDDCIIKVFGLENDEAGRICFDAIRKEP